MHVSAEYSPETGKFMMEGSFEQLACAQVMLQDILKQQQEIQKRQLRRLSSSAYRHRYGEAVEHGQNWSEGIWERRPMMHGWTGSDIDSHQHGATAAADSGYHRAVSCEGVQVSFPVMELI